MLCFCTFYFVLFEILGENYIICHQCLNFAKKSSLSVHFTALCAFTSAWAGGDACGLGAKLLKDFGKSMFGVKISCIFGGVLINFFEFCRANVGLFRSLEILVRANFGSQRCERTFTAL